MEELSPVRQFYRAYLARYRVARAAKNVYLLLRVNALQLRHYITWNTLHSLHWLKVHTRRKLHEATFVSSRFAQSTLTPIAHRARRSLDVAAARAASPRSALGLRLAAAGASGLATVFQRILGGGVRFFPLWTREEFSEEMGVEVPSRTLAPARTVELRMPDVEPAEAKGCMHAGTWSLQVPAIEAAEFRNATVMGRSDLIFTRAACIHHGLYDFDRDQLAEEMHGVVSINTEYGMVARYARDDAGKVPMAISMVGSTTANYIHWLTETAPKLAMVDDFDAWRDVPLVVDAGLHPNIMEAIRCLNTTGRPIVTLARWQMLTAERLLAIPAVAYVPFDFKPGLELDRLDIHPGYALYSPDGLNLVRQRLVSRLATGGTGKRRLYLRRAGKSRQMTNAEEVEALVRSLGFEIVEPESLSFAEQVNLFSQAEAIVGQGGAAFGNIMFAPEGCHVVILSTWSPYTIYYYFSNIASMLGQRCTYILCDPVEDLDGFHRAHKGLRVPLDALRQVIES